MWDLTISIQKISTKQNILLDVYIYNTVADRMERRNRILCTAVILIFLALGKLLCLYWSTLKILVCPNYRERSGSVVDLFVCFVALRPKSTAMVIAGRSVHLTTLFPGQA